MAARSRPAAEVDIDEPLVRSLLAEQFPDLASRPLGALRSGWDNATVRLGDDLAVRLPRRAAAAPLVEHEQRWLPVLAPTLPVPVPVPLRRGRPSRRLGYPWAWSVVPWLGGRDALAADRLEHGPVAAALGAFLVALHRPAPADAPANPVRGVPLLERDAVVRSRVAAAADLLDTDAALRVWETALAAPPWSGPPLWIHGDLHPGNLLVDDGGALAAVIDFGDLTAGDPATDLSVAWMLPAPAGPLLRAAIGDRLDDGCWARARGWALSHGLAVLESSADDPAYASMAAATVEAALAGEPARPSR